MDFDGLAHSFFLRVLLAKYLITALSLRNFGLLLVLLTLLHRKIFIF